MMSSEAKTAKPTSAKPTSAFERAKALFDLPNPESATEKAWESYIENRQDAAEYPGRRVQNKDRNGDDGNNDEDNGGDPTIYVLNSIRDTMENLEVEMGLDEGVLQNSFRLLGCDAEFEDEDNPRTVTTFTRIYSPTRPVYVDVHFAYHCRTRYDSIEWHYKLGFKIHDRPTTDDYRPSILTAFERQSCEQSYNSNGWHPLAYGYFDDMGQHGRRWKRLECRGFGLGYEEIVNVYETLWGPLEEHPERANEEATYDHRRKLVDSVRLLLAAVGIDYKIACKDDEDDVIDTWMLEGMGDRWLAREIRKVCGFQLKGDPENETKARNGLLEESLHDEEEDEDNSDRDSRCDGEEGDSDVDWRCR
ncbi:hypothetical protein GALMADRAFT_236202 [Galerina marginata CBS 339.88]|uniref:Uncharacterized protein n=1 Tax=Galerina marginata (strain CBS 339.88) TaxID=685588 RepID=A0A067TV40_GALM3|nr:hypothetical protein GALMADRAFT_236202 [Galerina marginata CBS 339.88]